MVKNKYKEKKKGVIRRFFGFMFYTKQFGSFKRNFGTPFERLSSSVQKLMQVSNLKSPAEQFDNAINRLGLSDADLKKRQKGFLINSIMLFFLGIFFGVVGIYLTLDGLVAAGLVTQIFTFISFSLALYMHFWFFQIKNRKLGCSFKEWWDNKIIDSNIE
tara:strand:+ start:2607 stop:3086 length:480 start_codon:yes stop_codon:yes gene_type:complete